MATKKKTEQELVETTEEQMIEPAQEEKPAKPAKAAKPAKKPIPKAIDLHEFIPVRNGTRGKLIYISPRTGEKYVWEEMGDTQEMELQELRNAKAGTKKFFERNWFMFDEEYDWVIDYLGVRGFYRHALRVDHLDDLFTMDPEEIKRVCSLLSKGQKRSIAYMARQAIANNEIDSMRVISALEEGLNTELIER